MLVVHVSDLHIDYRRYGKVNPITGLNTAWESSHRCWMYACQWAVDNHADAFVFGGDGFTNGRPTPEAAELVAEGFRLLSDAGIPAIIVRGNHELISVPATHRDINQRFADIPGVIVIDDAQNLFLPNGLQITAIPWPRRNQILADIPTDDMTPTEINHMVGQLLTDRIEELAEEIDPEAPALFAGHLTVSNASLGTDKRGSELLVHAVFEEPIVSVDVLEEGPWAHSALGHIHKRQQIADTVWYVGSPNRVDFSEEKDAKGFHAIRISDDNVADVEFVATPARQMRTLNAADGVPDDLAEGTLVRLVLPDGERTPNPALVSQFSAAGAYIAKIDARPVSVQRVASESLAVEVSELDGLQAWLEKNGVAEDTWSDLLAGAQELIDADQRALIDSTE
jgi:DNA repair protein SbcD/Mre11